MCSRDASTAVPRHGSEACGTTRALPHPWCVPRAGTHSCPGWRQLLEHTGLYGNQVFFDTMTTPRHLPFTLPWNPANFCTENTVGQCVYTETRERGFFGYAHWLYAGLK